jgi:hypothetical protein
MTDHSLASYVLALLNLMGMQEGVIDKPPLGTARRVGSATSTLDVPAHKLLQAIIEHSPSPETITREFLVELAKCGVSAVKDSGEPFFES